jgi:N-methylhydantoinase A/oxoprolinase/acetone carboxylase beta subunit
MVLREKHMDVPVMIVKGDGSLMGEPCAMEKPIETILSGPAASVAGAVYLTNQMHALVLDMGGTTTDTALISNGRVSVKNSGAKVGGWQPQIRAADLRTFGIGGDSLLSVSSHGGLKIGPEKVLPLCTAGNRYPNLLPELERIGSDECSAELLADCYAVAQRPGSDKLNNTEKMVLDFLGNEAHSLIRISKALGEASEKLDLERMVNQNILLKISLTPTDILHVLGVYREWDDTISRVGAEILAAKMKMGLNEFTSAAVCHITSRLQEACRESLTDFSKKMPGESDDLCLPSRMIAIGAPVKVWIPPVCQALHFTLVIPEHAEVANAVGAAAGQIVETAEVLVRPDKETEDFILHAPWECRHFKDYTEAVDYGVTAARNFVYQRAETAGANRIEVTDSREDIYIEGFFKSPKTFIETRIRAAAVGSPKWNPF